MGGTKKGRVGLEEGRRYDQISQVGICRFVGIVVWVVSVAVGL